MCSAALIVSGARGGTVGFHLGIAWYEYLYSQAWAILHYIRLFFWPDDLTIDYGQAMVRGWRGVPGILVLGTFGVATILAWTRAQRWGWFGFLGAWFFLLLAPSSSVVPIATEVAAERRIYLALASVIVLVVVGAEWDVAAAYAAGGRRFATTPRASGPGSRVDWSRWSRSFDRSRAFAQPERL